MEILPLQLDFIFSTHRSPQTLQLKVSITLPHRTATLPRSADMHGYSEDQLVEQPAIALFHEIGWEAVSASDELFGPGGTLQRETSAEVVLLSRLHAALQRLNPTLPAEA